MNSKIIFTCAIIFSLAILNMGFDNGGPKMGSSEMQANTLTLNDTLKIDFKETLTNQDLHLQIQFDTVVNDSRCPKGAQCVWEGNAVVVFRFNCSNESFLLSLNTNSRFASDTTICNYNISLTNLAPYPVLNQAILPANYSATIYVESE